MKKSELSILLLEDDDNDVAIIMDCVREGLRGVYVNWDRVATIEDALAHVEQKKYDICLSDYYLGERDAAEFLEKLRDTRVVLPVVLLTGQGDEQTAAQVMKLGSVDYLSKYDMDAVSLANAIRYALNWRFENEQRLRAEIALREAKESLERQNRKLTELNELKNRFLGVVSHDLLNPLHALMGFSKLLLTEWRELPAEEMDAILGLFHKSCDKMSLILGDLLDISAIESGRLQITPRLGSLREVVEERVKLNGIIARNKGIVIECELEAAPAAQFDNVRMAQVLDNLLGNAIKFSPRDARIRVRLWREGGRVAVSVSDEGAGIPAEEQVKLFLPFSRTKVSPSGGERSTGLGLAIVKSIVDAHAGEIRLRSQPGAGSEFTVFLPLA